MTTDLQELDREIADLQRRLDKAKARHEECEIAAPSHILPAAVKARYADVEREMRGQLEALMCKRANLAAGLPEDFGEKKAGDIVSGLKAAPQRQPKFAKLKYSESNEPFETGELPEDEGAAIEYNSNYLDHWVDLFEKEGVSHELAHCGALSALIMAVSANVRTLRRRVVELEARPSLQYRGTWQDGAYQRGDTVTWDGSLWHCNDGTSEKPGLSKSWQLVAKRGRDGKDGAKGERGPPGHPKEAAR